MKMNEKLLSADSGSGPVNQQAKYGGREVRKQGHCGLGLFCVL